MFIVTSSLDRIADLYEAGTLGLIEHDGWVEAFFDDRETAARFGEPHEAPDVDWVQQTQDAWPPLLVGEKFFLVAPWRTEPTAEGRFRLEINPGQQCGTGQHPCTQKCLEAMERIVKPGDSVLDVGSGSGILSLAAKLLGATLVVACDIDPEACVDFIGSVDAVRSNSFDVVVANINEEVIGRMRPDFERVATHRILSGFQNEEGEWTCIAFNATIFAAFSNVYRFHPPSHEILCLILQSRGWRTDRRPARRSVSVLDHLIDRR